MMNFRKILNRYNRLSKKGKCYLIVIFLIVAVMSWAFISAGIITGSFNRAHIKNNTDEQKVNAIGLIITETKNGTKYFEIYGENGYYDNTGKVATLNNVVGNFFKDGEVSMSFQSSKGAYNENDNSITLYENTYIVLKDETSLEADKLVWSGSDKDTVAEGHIKIRKGKEMTATAEKCVISADYENFKIIGKTQTKIYKK